MDTTSDSQIKEMREACAAAAENSAQVAVPAPVGLDRQCEREPMARAIRLIGDVWVLLIVVNLLPGTMRFNELLEAMGHVSSKTLSQRLKSLEELGIVERRAFYEIPPRVEYRLTEKGRDLGEVITAIEHFAIKHLTGSEGSSCS